MERPNKSTTKLRRSDQGNIENKENVDPLRPNVSRKYLGLNNQNQNQSSMNNVGYNNIEEGNFQNNANVNLQQQNGTEELLAGKVEIKFILYF
jgi:hypothetical protein